MWRVWLLFDPRRALVGMAVFLFTLAIVIHFIVLSTDRFNWIEGPSAAVSIQDVMEADVDITRLG
ncbi:MAG: light-harvesting antenna LH1, alpha subunit [Granulosicoccus sp.]